MEPPPHGFVGTESCATCAFCEGTGGACLSLEERCFVGRILMVVEAAGCTSRQVLHASLVHLELKGHHLRVSCEVEALQHCIQ